MLKDNLINQIDLFEKRTIAAKTCSKKNSKLKIEKNKELIIQQNIGIFYNEYQKDYFSYFFDNKVDYKECASKEEYINDEITAISVLQEIF